MVIKITKELFDANPNRYGNYNFQSLDTNGDGQITTADILKEKGWEGCGYAATNAAIEEVIRLANSNDPDPEPIVKSDSVADNTNNDTAEKIDSESAQDTNNANSTTDSSNKSTKKT